MRFVDLEIIVEDPIFKLCEKLIASQGDDEARLYRQELLAAINERIEQFSEIAQSIKRIMSESPSTN